MAVVSNQYTGNGSTTTYSFTFPYLNTADVKVKINGTTQNTTSYTLPTATTLQFNTAPSNGSTILIFRDTNNDAKKATFYPGSAIKAEDLNNDFDQILYTVQEVDTFALSALGDDSMQGDFDVGNNKLTNVGTPTASTDGANKTYVDSNTWDKTTDTYASGETWTGNNTTIATSGAIDARIDSKVDTAIEGDVLVGTDLSKSASSGQVTISHNVTGANTTVNNSNGNVLQDITVTAQGHVTAVGSTDLDGRYYTETELDAGQLDNRYYTETQLDAGQLDNRYYTETELNAGQLDNRYYTETEADSRFYNLSSGEEIQSGETWTAADNKIATTAAIDARITDLVDDVGGFVPIDNETSFPNANPDVNNGTGTLVSIKALSSNLTSNGSGVATIANGTVGNSTVTITGLANSTTYASTYGMIVETTSTLNTYTFHRLVPKATEVSTVSSNITNINAVGSNSTNINTVAGVSSNVTTVAGIASNVTTVAGIASNVTTVAGISSDVTAVAADATDIGAVAAKATEIGRLGTADAVSDLNTLGTTAIVTDLDTCATNIANINNVGGSIANVNTVATNISSVNDFSDLYRIASSDPTSHLHVGDLVFNTTSNELRVYNGSSWQGGVTATGDLLAKSGGQMTGNITFSGSQTVDGRDVSADGTKLDGIATGAEVNVQSDWNATSGDAVILNKPTISSTTINNNAANRIITGSGTSGELNATQYLTFDGSNLDFPYGKARWNTGASNILQIRATDTQGTIEHLGTATLRIVADTVEIRDPTNWETSLQAKANGEVKLYYNNSKKFETTSAGVDVNGTLTTSGATTISGTCTATSFSGDGSNLTNLPGGGGTAWNSSLYSLTTPTAGNVGSENYANENISLGKFAGYALTGSNTYGNTFLGTKAGYACTTGRNNCIIGWNTGEKLTTGDENIIIGGQQTGDELTTGDNNVILGDYCGHLITTGAGNVAIGYSAMQGQTDMTTGSDNIAIGSGAGQRISTGHSNVALGKMAMERGNTGHTNVAIGSQAGYSQKGYNNVSIGYQAGYGDYTSFATGEGNVCIGTYAGYDLTTGTYNILIGNHAGRNAYSPSGEIDTESNVICLGSNSVTDFYCAETTISSSDERDKADITNFTHGLAWVNQLQPITYVWDKRCWYYSYDKDGKVTKEHASDGSKKKTKKHIGFKAQDVLAVEKSSGFAGSKDDMLVVNLNEDDTAYGLKYERLVPVLVNAIKELSAKVTALEAKA